MAAATYVSNQDVGYSMNMYLATWLDVWVLGSLLLQISAHCL